MTTILALDPGETTGWAYAEFDEHTAPEFLAGGQIEGGVEGLAAWAWSHGQQYDLVDIKVSESFILRPAVKNPNLEPVRIEGFLNAYYGKANIFYQPPSKKSLAPDRILHAGGLWIPGQRHHMDARIHVLAHLVGQTHLPTLKKYYSQESYDE